MRGLSAIIDNSRDQGAIMQVIRKGITIKPHNPFSSSPTTTETASCSTSGFLEHCFLCSQKLPPGKDIYMYNGDKAFCSQECRCKQISVDEKGKCG